MLPNIESETHEVSFQVPEPDALVEWLVGVGGGGFARDHRQPYEWVLNRLYVAYNQKDAQIGLASIAAMLLEDFLKGDLAPRWRGDRSFLMYNLLRLCSGIRRPQQLWQPLSELFHAAATGNLPRELDNPEFRAALQAALIPNQVGPDLRQEWVSVATVGNSVLGGNERNAFWGVLHMPERCGALDRPWIDAIEEVLRLLSRQYEEDPDEFQAFLDRARGFWPSYEPWDYELEMAAVKAGWPLWAVWRLRAHTVRSPDDSTLWLVSDYVKDSVPNQFGAETLANWPEARISLVRAHPDSVGVFFGVVGELFDRLCRELGSGFQGDRSRKFLFAELLERWGKDPNRRRDMSPSWSEARSQIMASIRMPTARSRGIDEAAKRQIEKTVDVVDEMMRECDNINERVGSPSSAGGQRLLEGLAARIAPSLEMNPDAY